MHHLSRVYFVNQPLHVSGLFVAHHQEVYCIYTTIGTCCAFQLTVCWPGWDGTTVGFYYIDVCRVHQRVVCCCCWLTCKIVAIVMSISFVVSLNSVGIFGTLVVVKLNHSSSALLSHVDCVWNVMAHAQKPDFVFRQNGLVHLNRRGRQFSRLLTAEVWASAVVMLDTPCSEVVWRVLATHSIRQFPLHFPSHASCAITFQLDSSWTCDIPVCVCVCVW